MMIRIIYFEFVFPAQKQSIFKYQCIGVFTKSLILCTSNEITDCKKKKMFFVNWY